MAKSRKIEASLLSCLRYWSFYIYFIYHEQTKFTNFTWLLAVEKETKYMQYRSLLLSLLSTYDNKIDYIFPLFFIKTSKLLSFDWQLLILNQFSASFVLNLFLNFESIDVNFSNHVRKTVLIPYALSAWVKASFAASENLQTRKGEFFFNCLERPPKNFSVTRAAFNYLKIVAIFLANTKKSLKFYSFESVQNTFRINTISRNYLTVDFLRSRLETDARKKRQEDRRKKVCSCCEVFCGHAYSTGLTGRLLSASEPKEVTLI